jgi:hypothetical protein
MADSIIKVSRFITAATEGVILLKILNSLSLRFSSFIDPTIRKGLINPFFRLLNFPGKSAEIF